MNMSTSEEEARGIAGIPSPATTMHVTACDFLSTYSLLGTDLRVQMTILLLKREEGRLAILQRASTRILLAGQTTPIPTTRTPPLLGANRHTTLYSTYTDTPHVLSGKNFLFYFS